MFGEIGYNINNNIRL